MAISFSRIGLVFQGYCLVFRGYGSALRFRKWSKVQDSGCFRFRPDAPINNSVLIDPSDEHSINFITEAPQGRLVFGFGF